MAACIRKARAADAARLTSIAHAAKRHWGYPESLIELWRADLTVTADFIDAHPVFCAELPPDLIGFYALSQDGEELELEHMWVEPVHMGAGVGAMLLEHAIATARSLGGSLLSIASDPNAEGFYLHMGARRIGEEPAQPAGRVLPVLVVDLTVPTGNSAA